MVTLNRAAWVLFPLATIVVGGCNENGSGSATTAAPPATTAAAQASVRATAAVSAATPPPTASAEAMKPEHAFLRGPAGMLFAAARDAGLKDDQKATIEKLEQSLRDAPGPKAEMKDLHTDLVAAVKAGTIDAKKLAPRFDAIDKAMQAHKDKEAEALNGLHAALDAAQRKTVVAAVRTKQAEREAKAAGHEHMGGDMAKRRLDRMTKELDLDAAQQKKVESLMAADKPSAEKMTAMKDEMKKRMDAMLTAFEGDSFDAKKLDMGPGPGKGMREGFDKHVAFMSQLLPVLKPEQREKLAASMEKMHERGMRGGPGAPDQGYGMMLFDDHDGPAEGAAPGAPPPVAPTPEPMK